MKKNSKVQRFPSESKSEVGDSLDKFLVHLYLEQMRENIANDLGASPATLDKRGSAGEQEWVIKSPARDVKNQHQNMQESLVETFI